MEFRAPYLMEMQRQNPKMYRRLRDSNELDRFVELKAREAERMYRGMLADGMPERESVERTQAAMFQYPSEDSPKQDEKRSVNPSGPILQQS